MAFFYGLPGLNKILVGLVQAYTIAELAVRVQQSSKLITDGLTEELKEEFSTTTDKIRKWRLSLLVLTIGVPFLVYFVFVATV